ncbi:hypothetical protein [Streptomyces sp. NPDC057686]|uniref:hypothetical protein n=1 Tax=Streptomyces sp. NPDC057686 TaxID=3346212 RepID=UPI0036766F11
MQVSTKVREAISVTCAIKIGEGASMGLSPTSVDDDRYEYSTVYVRYPYGSQPPEFFPRSGSVLSVVVAHNDYQDGPPAAVDFLRWPTVLECEAVPPASPQEVVTAVSGILQELWSRRIGAVAVCDFEEELPVPPS